MINFIRFHLLILLFLVLQSLNIFSFIIPFQLHQPTSLRKGWSFQTYDKLLDDTIEHQIFCNREINGESIQAVGFDMDFTLAQYNEAFDLLAFNGAKEKLHRVLGYPAEVLDFTYDSAMCRRGLIIDRTKGNILKIDRHKYVRKVFHGLTELPSNERKAAYQTAYSQMPTFTESNYVNIDTLFLLIDAMLFMQLVDLRDENPEIATRKSYEQLYKDIRASVDLCHRDGVIKNAVMRSPDKYIQRDPRLVPMLQRIRDSGKKVFLLTNSLWTYTDAVMTFLTKDFFDSLAFDSGTSNDDNGTSFDWTRLFDVVIVGAAKPAFLMNDYMSLFIVNRDGTLQNIEDKDSFQLASIPSNVAYGHPFPESQTVLQGGHWKDLHRLLGVSSGDSILYVGDHMYADILRSKRTLGWRTCLIIPELEDELQIAQQNRHLLLEIKELKSLQFDLDEYLDVLHQVILLDPVCLQNNEIINTIRALHRRAGFQRQKLGANTSAVLQEAEAKEVELKNRIRELTNSYEDRFNQHWGLVMKAGSQDSRFAQQVVDYACLYTSRASNLGLVSPNRPFRPSQDFMPHEVFFESPKVAGITGLT